MTEKVEPPAPVIPEEEAVEIKYVSVSTEEEGHKVILKEEAEAQGQLEMFVGGSEMAAIAKELGLLDATRPLTHEIYAKIIDGLDVTFEKVEIYGLEDNAYLAQLHYTKEGRPQTLDIRPSDGVALALSKELPIRLNKRLLKGTLSASDQASLADMVKAVKF